jgi:tripartite ATP-independent transporter DctP family solute receptor
VLHGDSADTIKALIAELKTGHVPRFDDWAVQAKALGGPLPSDESKDGHLSATDFLDQLFASMPPKAIVTTDVGQHQMWTAQRFKPGTPRDFCTSAGLGSMGFGFPGRDRRVLRQSRAPGVRDRRRRRLPDDDAGARDREALSGAGEDRADRQPQPRHGAPVARAVLRRALLGDEPLRQPRLLAFKDSATAFRAMDGALGDFVIEAVEAKGIHCIARPYDNGMRHITANKPIHTAADVDGLKIRVPASALFVDMWKTLGASPTPINVSELYSALQTHIVEAEENALINIEQTKLYEVQKTLNFSGHAWSCWWMLANKDAWDALGKDIQGVVTRNMAKYATLQRQDFAALDISLRSKLKTQGMQEYQCDVATFKAKLGPYYAKWKGQFGPTAWNALEKYTGTLA